jgi:hypothetical protein
MKSDGTSLQHSQLALAAATVVRPNEEPLLWFQLPNLPILCIPCRPRKRLMKVESDYAAASISKPELSLHATDPRIYGAGVATEFGVPPVTHELNNEGNTEMRPILVITGPATRPKMENESIEGKPFLELVDPKAEEEEKVFFGKEREKREVKENEEEKVILHARLKKEEEDRALWKKELEELKVSVKHYEEKLAAQKVEAEAAFKKEVEEIEARKVAGEKTEKEAEEAALAARETEEKEGLKPTIKATDQVLIDLSTPHIIRYYPGGIAKNEPIDISQWIAPGSVWFDLLPALNKLAFTSFETTATEGAAEVQWAPAYEI